MKHTLTLREPRGILQTDFFSTAPSSWLIKIRAWLSLHHIRYGYFSLTSLLEEMSTSNVVKAEPDSEELGAVGKRSVWRMPRGSRRVRNLAIYLRLKVFLCNQGKRKVFGPNRTQVLRALEAMKHTLTLRESRGILQSDLFPTAPISCEINHLLFFRGLLTLELGSAFTTLDVDIFL
ncbi:hypothetical protein PIB30_010174 [Stylosanthes scabra]|uniref:Uncharacterized protein n=1 Tax=Stylosanthes scabra TaxID=79078 RepID=A0ABU6Q5G2_9FABA|nr:hypothetical protein [Stylosanthes scabra]